jgi:hypothetical protein
MGGGCSGTMNGNVVERIFHRDYDEQEDDCTLTRHTVWTPAPTGGSAGRLVEDAIRAGERDATRTFDAPTPFLGGASFLAVPLFQPRSRYSAGSGKSSRTFAPLHQVCTGISEKVQTKMPAKTMTILLSDVYIERYVQIRIVLCTICTGNGEPPAGATRVRVPVKSGVVQTSW